MHPTGPSFHGHPFMDLHSDTDQLFMIKIVQRKNIDIDIAIFTLDISISISKALQDIDPSLVCEMP